MADNDRNRRGANDRVARLEAELRANLKKRKDQARARARAATAEADPAPIGAREDCGE
jgi:hypothetical protein